MGSLASGLWNTATVRTVHVRGRRVMKGLGVLPLCSLTLTVTLVLLLTAQHGHARPPNIVIMFMDDVSRHDRGYRPTHA